MAAPPGALPSTIGLIEQWGLPIGTNSDGRADLVPYLKSLTPGELSAYCSGVLAGAGMPRDASQALLEQLGIAYASEEEEVG